MMTSTRTRQRDEHDAELVLEVRNPATGGVVDTVPQLDGAAVGALVQRARRAQPAWAALGDAGRARVVDRFRRRLHRHRELLIEALQSETAKPWEDCNADVMLTTTWAAQSMAGRHSGWPTSRCAGLRSSVSAAATPSSTNRSAWWG